MTAYVRLAALPAGAGNDDQSQRGMSKAAYVSQFQGL
jgi:hypothetical protein